MTVSSSSSNETSLALESGTLSFLHHSGGDACSIPFQVLPGWKDRVEMVTRVLKLKGIATIVESYSMGVFNDYIAFAIQRKVGFFDRPIRAHTVVVFLQQKTPFDYCRPYFVPKQELSTLLHPFGHNAILEDRVLPIPVQDCNGDYFIAQKSESMGLDIVEIIATTKKNLTSEEMQSLIQAHQQKRALASLFLAAKSIENLWNEFREWCRW